MKRTRNGVLIQGTIVHPTGALSKDFVSTFQKKVAEWLHVKPNDLTGTATPRGKAIYEDIQDTFHSEKWAQRRP